ncbi:MAG: RsmB/NOP family class I SAM-dependent RNA methyltransferase [Lachnospiraceae bacterium]
MELPVLFEERMRRMLPPEEYEQFLKSYEREQYHALRVNTLKIRRKEFLERGLFDLEPVPWCENGFYYGENERPGKHPFHEAGLYYIQEPSAMSAAALADVQPGEYVLDLCAAPGGKSTQLASALQGQGLLVANEIHPARAKILSQNIERMGVRNALVTNETPQSLALRFPAFFDRIIVDAPCSGEGMFFKEEQALIHWSPENVQMWLPVRMRSWEKRRRCWHRAERWCIRPAHSHRRRTRAAWYAF